VVVGGDYYYSCMCSLYARIYFSLYDGSEGELVSYIYPVCWCALKSCTSVLSVGVYLSNLWQKGGVKTWFVLVLV
jgi:hypothetical protein